MIGIHVSVDATVVRKFLVAITGEIENPRRLNANLVDRLTDVLKAHFLAKNSEPNKMGAPKTNFWNQVAADTKVESISETGATVQVAEQRFNIQLFGGTILPVNAKFLTIPLIPEARGKFARDYERDSGHRLFTIPGRNVLFEQTGDGVGQYAPIGLRGRVRGKNRGFSVSPYDGANREQGAPSCLAFAVLRVEKAIVEAVLEACQPLGVEASLQVLEKSHEERDQKRKALELALEKARYEAGRARRQYDAADPENRLVAAELENRWNAAVVQVAELESRLDADCQVDHSLSQSQRERLTTLGADLQTLWSEATTPMDLKKRVLGTVINEVVVDVNHDSGHIEMNIHWAGGVHTPLRVRKNQVGKNGNATDANIVGLVTELAKGWNDANIASMLNRSGLLTGKGNNWNETRVKNLRRENDIPVFSKSQLRTWKTMLESSALLGVSNCVVRTMVRNKILPARQIAKGAPWMIDDTDLELPAVRNYAKQARTGKSAPCDNNTQLLDL